MKYRLHSNEKRRIACVIVGLFLVCVVLASVQSGTGAYVAYYGTEKRLTPIYSVERADGKIAITFDCAWGVDSTDKLLEVMAGRDVKCTFFMTEFWAEKYPDYVSKIHDAGHEVGTHSATHSYMSKQSEEEIKKELVSSSSAIEKIIGGRVSLFRPPYGDYNNLLLKTCEKGGFYAIQWDVDSLDWKDLSAEDITKRVLKRVKSGSIILCHNNGKNTAEALPAIIDGCRERGLDFLPVGELIYKTGYTVNAYGRQIKNND